MEMLLEVLFRDGEESFVISVDKEFENKIKDKLPLRALLRVWKEEVYFETPIDLSLPPQEGCLKVVPGELYYWPPGKAFCIFYGVSQPYTPVHRIGRYVGILNYLRKVEGDEEASISLYEGEGEEEFGNLFKKLRGLGYDAALVKVLGDPTPVASKYLSNGIRVAFQAFVEDYGIHLEGEPLMEFSSEPLVSLIAREISERVGDYSRVRVDLTEDGDLALTGYAGDEGELLKTVKEFEEASLKVAQILEDLRKLFFRAKGQ